MVKIVLPILLLLLCLARVAESTVVPCGSEWINIHAKNSDLVGVIVEQYPTHKVDRALYEGKHLAMVIFIFKGNRAHQLSFTPSGQVRDGFWWDIPVGHSIFDEMSTDLKFETICRAEAIYDFSSE